MDKIYTYEKQKGFTLVELLAVIVILAIIMLLAIPAVLDTMAVAKRKTFVEYIDKAVNQAQNKITEAQLLGEGASGCVIYNIKNDLGFSNTGDFDGYILINTLGSEIYVTMYDKDQMISAYEYGNGSPEGKVEVYNNDPDTLRELTSDYLCGQADGCTLCQVKNPETGESQEIVSEKPVPSDGALLLDGPEFGKVIYSFTVGGSAAEGQYDSTITSVKYTNEVNESGKLVTKSNSPNPAYMWLDGTTIYIGTKSTKLYVPSDASWMFGYMLKLNHIDFEYFDFSRVENASGMFAGDSAFSTFDATILNGAKLTSLEATLAGLPVTSIDVSGWDTSRVTNMFALFNSVSKLTSLDLSSFDTSNVTNMQSMFWGTSSLKSLDVSMFDTSNVTSMYGMFSANNFTTLDLSNFDTSKVTDMGFMFSENKKLTNLILPSTFKTGRVVSMDHMFYYCSALENLDLSNFDTRNVTNMNAMFLRCESIKEIDFSDKDLSSLTTAWNLAMYCKKIEEFKLGKVKLKNAIDMHDAFPYCYALKVVDLSSVTSFTDCSRIFGGCKVLEVAYINDNYTGSLTFEYGNCPLKTWTKKAV